MLLLIFLIVCTIQNSSGNVGNYIFPPLPIAVTDSGNVVCDRQSREYRDNLDNFTLWAYEMRDATAQSTTSVLRGSIFSFGNFHQCLTARAPFPTKYCLVVVTANVTKFRTPRDPFSLYYSSREHIINKLFSSGDVTQQARNVVKMGWCLPSSCTTSQAEKSLNIYYDNVDNDLKKENVTFSANIPSVLCQSSNQQKALDVYDILFCTIAVGLILIVVFSTIWDFNCADITKKHYASDVIMAFSARGNFLDLAKPESDDKSLAILYGIKAFSMCMIIIDHRFGTSVSGPIMNFDAIEKSYRNISCSYIFHGDLFVDTFFILSGLLVIYNLMGLYKKRFINPGLVFVMRYLRLTPSYAFVVFFCATILYHTGNGPLWEAIIGTERVDCRQTWWTNILYVSNYVNVEHTCLVPSWYLPCDFHYFIIALGVTVLYQKCKKVALPVFAILVVMSIIVPFFIIFCYERQAFLRFLPDFLNNIKMHEEVVLTYTKTHFRSSPYFVGMIAGYVSYKTKDKVAFSKCYANTVLIISFVLMGIMLFAGAIFYSPYHTYKALEHAFYGSLHRTIWSLGTIGLVFAIGYGERGFIYDCLSWKVWIPISKLVFGAYLTHFPIQMRILAMKNAPTTFQVSGTIFLALSDIFLAFALGLLLYLIVEAPSKKLFRIMFLPKKTSKEETKTKIFLALSDIFLAFALGLLLYLIVEAPSKKLFRIMFLPKKTSKEETKTKVSSNL